jgi:hydroxymethylbilane synthase
VNATTLRLGSRRSQMAITQSRLVAQLITASTGREVEIVGITTLGDVSREQLTQIGGTGVFVSALREALLAGEVDLAVHSVKDLPAVQPPQVALAAVPVRDDPRDALVAQDGAKLADLPTGARVGTGSPRRAAQLLALRNDLRCVPIRGNADTRMAKVGSGEVDAVVLAYAGLARLGQLSAVTQVFELDEMLPAPGQGALAIECREGDRQLTELLGAVNDEPSMAAIIAERGLLETLAAGCSAPVAAHAVYEPGQQGGNPGVAMRAAAMTADGNTVLRVHGRSAGQTAMVAARQLGSDLATELLRCGAAQLIRVPQAPR